MFGLSFGKLLVLVVVVVVAWRSTRILGAIQRRLENPAPPPQRTSGDRRAAEPARATEELVECPKCGLYVPNGTFCVSRERCSYRPS